MVFFNLFSGKSPEEHLKKGETLFKAASYGNAKIEFESGLHKLGKKETSDSGLKKRLQDRILQSKEALALQHKARGDEIMESQYYEGAEEAFLLALELTENSDLEIELQEQLKKIREYYIQEKVIDSKDFQTNEADSTETNYHVQEDEYFMALCGSFADKEREQAYNSYGNAFREGFLALNQGDFDLAVTRLSEAMEKNSLQQTYIPLELATAYLNLGKSEKARELLTSFLKDYPESLQGYQLLCETFWERKEFDHAHELLQDCPQELTGSPQICILRGETLFQEEKFQETKALFLDYLEASQWDENIALSLAGAYEALDEKKKARDIYGDVMAQCSGCGKQIAPFIKQKYSDISLECGEISTSILEIYLSLVQEDPTNKGHYFQKIIEIYTALGNEDEAQRYRSFAEESG